MILKGNLAEDAVFPRNGKGGAKGKIGRARETFQRDNLLVNQNDAWRYKVTRQRTRLTINFNTRQHQILRRCFPRSVPSFPFSFYLCLSLSLSLPHPPTPTANAYPSASATVRLMPRSPTTIILGDLRSRSISLTTATNYYPPLNPRHRPTAGAAPRHRPGETGKKNHAAMSDTIGAFAGCCDARINRCYAKNASRGMRVRGLIARALLSAYVPLRH